MSTPGDNRGIHIGGRANVSGQVASGDNVTQRQHVGTASPQVTDAIAQLEQLIERHADELDQAERARRDVSDIRDEAEATDPDPDRLTDALQRLGGRVAGVAVLTKAVRQLAAQLGLG